MFYRSRECSLTSACIFTVDFDYILFIVLPTGKAPALEIDGKIYCESGAIAKYLAREFSKCVYI